MKKKKIENHGIAAAVSECRCAIAAEDEHSNPIVIVGASDEAVRIFLLVINVKTGESHQYWYPDEDTAAQYGIGLFTMCLASNGRFVYMRNEKAFLEFDLVLRKWSFAEEYTVSRHHGASMVEGQDGTIYTAIYPTTELFAFYPRTRTIINLGRMDQDQDYPFHLATDSSGWVYAGIGTAQANIAAFNPWTNEHRDLVTQGDRILGRGWVYKGVDGEVYGRLMEYHDSEERFNDLEVKSSHPWMRLFEGRASRVKHASPPAPTTCAIYGESAIYGEKFVNTFPDGGKFEELDFSNKSLRYIDSYQKETTVEFDYVSGGSGITRLISGPGEKIYGGTMHPMHFFSYDPATKELKDYKDLKKVEGGNFCGLTSIDNTIFGIAYAGGWLYSFDTTRIWEDSEEQNANPKFLGSFVDVYRPRTILAHPDKSNIIAAGFPIDGDIGGSIIFYNIETNKSTVLRHKDFMPGCSTVTLRALPNGDIIGGTSVETPCGARPIETEGKLYIIDWTTREIIIDITPIPGAREISSIEVDSRGTVYGITETRHLFVFDSNTMEIIYTLNLQKYGYVTRCDESLLLGPDDNIYVVLDKAILQINTKDCSCEKLMTLSSPNLATAGIAICKGRLYYASGSRLFSCPVVS